MRILLVSSVLLVIMLVSQQHDNEKTNDPPSFYKEVYPIFFSKCSGKECHGGDSRASVRYATYRSIYAYRKKIIKRINDQREPMPPENSPALTDKEINLIELWINSGAPEN